MQQVSKWNVFWRSLANIGSLFQLCLLLLVHMESHSLNGGHRAYSSCGRRSPQRLGDFKERIFRQRNRGVRYAEVSCRSHACTADTIKDRGFWKCISELKKVMPCKEGESHDFVLKELSIYYVGIILDIFDFDFLFRSAVFWTFSGIREVTLSKFWKILLFKFLTMFLWFWSFRSSV